MSVENAREVPGFFVFFIFWTCFGDGGLGNEFSSMGISGMGIGSSSGNPRNESCSEFSSIDKRNESDPENILLVS